MAPDPSALLSLLVAIGRAVLPAGELIPVFGEASARRALAYVEDEGRQATLGFRAFLRAVDVGVRLRYGHGAVRAAPAEVRAVLRALEAASYPSRIMVKYGLAPIKVMHLDDPGFFDRIGCDHLPPAAQPERDRVRERQVFDADALEGVTHLEADVVVVGTGAGGAVVGYELARRGHQVVFLEAGAYFDRGDFTSLRRTRIGRLLYQPIAETTAVGNVMIPVLAGRTVGGTTTINSGTSYRAPDHVLAAWASDHGLPELGPDALRPYFDRVESILEVGPTEDRYLGGCARVVARGAAALGWTHGPLPRNAPGCDGQGVCCFGCPTDAKQSTNISYVPRALAAGALLIPRAQVERVLVRGGGAYGVRAMVDGGEDAPPRSLVVTASRVVLACGALYTPPLMTRSGVGGASGHLGRHLSIHPAAGCYALFDELIDQSRAVPQGYGIEEFQREGILFEGASTPAEMFSMDIKATGPDLVRILERYHRIAAFGFMVKDRSRGRVLTTPSGRPRVLYHLGSEEVARLRRGMRILVQVYRAAGALEIYPPVHGHGALRSPGDVERFLTAPLGARDFELTAYHPLGTARVSPRAGEGVVDLDHEVYDTRRLHVVDGSCLPGSPGVNPQITIMALATRAAERIHDALRAEA